MFLSMNPKKPWGAVNTLAKITYLSIVVEALLFFAYAVSGGSLFGGHLSVIWRVASAFGAYLILDNGLVYLRGKASLGVQIALVVNLLLAWFYTKHISHALDKVALASAVISFILLLLPASRKHISKDKTSIAK